MRRVVRRRNDRDGSSRRTDGNDGGMSMAQGEKKEPRRVLMSVDGHEEPEFVIEHALGAIKAHLYRFVMNTVKANTATYKKWETMRAIRAKRANPAGRGSSSGIRSSEDARALLKDINEMPDMREVFRAAFTEGFGGDAIRADLLMERLRARRFMNLCNNAVHGERVSVTDAADTVGTLALLAKGIGAPVEALHLRMPLQTLDDRVKWKNSRSAPAPAPLKAGVTCVGVHWVQPRRVVPGSWWIIALLPSEDAAVEVDLTSDGVVEYLLELSGPVVAGLAFCFSAPKEFVQDQPGGSVDALWRWAKDVAGDDDRDKISDDLPKPFRFVKGDETIRSPRTDGKEFFRETEMTIFNELGVEPASIFDIGGEGSVGALAIKGMPILAALREPGVAIWPMDDPLLADGLTCVEIFPRSVWTSMYPADHPRSKKNVMRRWNFIADRRDDGVVISDSHAAELATDERAFDALLTAWALRRHGGNLGPVLDDPVALIEGRIWVP